MAHVLWDNDVNGFFLPHRTQAYVKAKTDFGISKEPVIVAEEKTTVSVDKAIPTESRPPVFRKEGSLKKGNKESAAQSKEPASVPGLFLAS